MCGAFHHCGYDDGRFYARVSPAIASSLKSRIAEKECCVLLELVGRPVAVGKNFGEIAEIGLAADRLALFGEKFSVDIERLQDDLHRPALAEELRIGNEEQIAGTN